MVILTEQERKDNDLWADLARENRERNPYYDDSPFRWVSDPFQVACLFYGMASKGRREPDERP